MKRVHRARKWQAGASAKAALLQWGAQQHPMLWLDSNAYPQTYGSFDALLAVGERQVVSGAYGRAFEQVKAFYDATRDWIFGYWGYDLKNEVENLQSNNHDGLGFPDFYFFQPEKILMLQHDTLHQWYPETLEGELDTDWEWLQQFQGQEVSPATNEKLHIQARLSREQYLNRAAQMLAHIQRGDIYEANFCMEFYTEQARLQPLMVYEKLNAISHPPFACYYQNESHYLMSASPERYLRKQGNKLISQPIKGTAKRLPDAQADAAMRESLRNNEKERAENIMIVDLVRNDLSHHALKGSVQVEELCGIYTFEQVHQMISTVSAEVRTDTHPVDVIRDSFPMGSMTGAPKISAMKIIDNLEASKRGVYSGAVGYFTPEGDFDFNVVIRSIAYNAQRQYASFTVGSAITAQAQPEAEYEECLLKAQAMFRVLES